MYEVWSLSFNKLSMKKPLKKKEGKKGLIGDGLYMATYDIDAVDYYQEFRNTGEVIEVFQQYKRDAHIIENAPRPKEVDQILELLKKTGIKKLTIVR